MGFSIAGRPIGDDHPTYIIAEMSANHVGSYDNAVAIVHAAVDAGADAIKLQTYDADALTIDCDREYFRIGAGTPWEGRGYHELYDQAHMPWNWQPKLKKLADELGIHCFSSPFDGRAVDFLEAMEVPAYKIASFELVDLPLIERVASTGKPLIMSTGMATEEEIERAIQGALTAGAAGVAILKCTSAYPAPVNAANLRTIPALAERFQVPVGLSDHTLDSTVVVTAIALGARIVEKHLTLARSLGGPDREFSLEPDEFAAMVRQVRICEQALGEVHFGVSAAEQASRKFRRSLFAVANISTGDKFTNENMRSIRPGDGLPPHHYKEILGRNAAQNIERGTPLSWELID